MFVQPIRNAYFCVSKGPWCWPPRLVYTLLGNGLRPSCRDAAPCAARDEQHEAGPASHA